MVILLATMGEMEVKVLPHLVQEEEEVLVVMEPILTHLLIMEVQEVMGYKITSEMAQTYTTQEVVEEMAMLLEVLVVKVVVVQPQVVNILVVLASLILEVEVLVVDHKAQEVLEELEL